MKTKFKLEIDLEKLMKGSDDRPQHEVAKLLQEVARKMIFDDAATGEHYPRESGDIFSNAGAVGTWTIE